MSGLPNWAYELVLMLIPVVVLVLVWGAMVGLARIGFGPRALRESVDPDSMAFDRTWLQSGWAAIAVAVVSWAGENIQAHESAPAFAKAAATLAPFAPAIWFIVAWRREFFHGDELDRRIHLDALSAAFPAFVLMMVGYGLFDLLRWPSPSASMRWQWMPSLYGLWLWIFKFRYVSRVDRPRAGAARTKGREP